MNLIVYCKEPLHGQGDSWIILFNNEFSLENKHILWYFTHATGLNMFFILVYTPLSFVAALETYIHIY